MDFSFVHVADLHLGSPLLGISARDPELASTLATASRDAFTDLIDQAIAREADFVLIAGDVYDGEWKDASIGLFFNRQISKLVRAGIPVYSIRGNHDAVSVVTQSVRLPAGVVEFPAKNAKTEIVADLKVAIHGQSFPARAVPEDLAASYPKPVPGHFNIGLLHTSCDGSIGEHATYAPCSLGDLVSKGYQYWALGHIHGYRELHRSPHIVFPGNLQGRGVHECGPKGALFVKVKDDQVETERIIVDRVRWFDVGIDVENCPTPEEVFAQIELQLQDAMSSVEFSAFDRQLVFRIRLQGNTALHNVFIRDRLEIQDDIQATLHHLGEHVWLEQLKIETTDVAAIQANSDHLLDPMDLTSSIEAISATSEFHEHAKAIFAEILRKLPAGTSESQLFPVQEIDDMIAEAGQFLVTRSAAKGAKAS